MNDQPERRLVTEVLGKIGLLDVPRMSPSRVVLQKIKWEHAPSECLRVRVILKTPTKLLIAGEIVEELGTGAPFRAPLSLARSLIAFVILDGIAGNLVLIRIQKLVHNVEVPLDFVEERMILRVQYWQLLLFFRSCVIGVKRLVHLSL